MVEGIAVVFDMWGQRCQTVFDDTSELTPLEWLKRMTEKGWLLPIEVYRENDNIVLYTQDELRVMFEE